MSSPTATIVGFPMRATRDPDLAGKDLRVLICIGILAGATGSCGEDLGWLAEQTAMPAPAVLERLDWLSMRGYVRRRRVGEATMLSLVPDTAALPDRSDLTPREENLPSSPRRGAGPTAQASLHSGMLRRSARRQSGAIEFDDPSPPHPVVASLQESMQSASGGVDGFRFWLKTILDPEDVEIFSGWAGRQSTEYRKLVTKFESADDDNSIESLLEDTIALVNREKTPNR